MSLTLLRNSPNYGQAQDLTPTTVKGSLLMSHKYSDNCSGTSVGVMLRYVRSVVESLWSWWSVGDSYTLLSSTALLLRVGGAIWYTGTGTRETRDTELLSHSHLLSYSDTHTPSLSRTTHSTTHSTVTYDTLRGSTLRGSRVTRTGQGRGETFFFLTAY